MNFPHFVRIDRDGRGAGRHYVVHTHDPKFTLELTADSDAPNKIGKGVLKRVCVPNSWAGDYSNYARMISAAQDFFAASQSDGPRPAR